MDQQANATAAMNLQKSATEQTASSSSRSSSPAACRDLIATAASMTAALLDADSTQLLRFEASGGTTMIAQHHGSRTVLGPRLPASSGLAELVLCRGRPTRLDSSAASHRQLTEPTRRAGRIVSIGAPITIDDRVWGALVVHWSERTPPLGTEGRLVEVTDLVAAAVVNAESRMRLNASRARIVRAADDVRRGFERDLHDGVQQRLVSLGLELRTLEGLIGDDHSGLKPRIGRTIEGLTRAYEDLQAISRRLHPAILAQRGLPAALKTLARRSPIPVTINVRSERRFCGGVETAAYHAVSEALTLVAEHAQASAVTVDVDVTPATATAREMLELSIHEDGTGGDDAALDSGVVGLVGLVDRVEALGGRLRLAGPAPGRTSLLVTLPADGSAVPTGRGSVER
ncbi:histidine kinase [Dactylosporangium sp. AC04546]|uniref:GAF domain-containing sensor histidine kinase n=1 Tax=Dactylosporangium sp. AC04546 TaxID=2862460 RepID=UPI001EE0268B|nr:histidine kinase [Dactylosporangium sp. AC04546]WVK84233.1 histidine kinase [Dactylosporangium sp. AC04546]